MTVRLTTPDNREWNALRVNEDSFTIQIKDTAGQFHSFDKLQLKSFERLPNQSLMPSYSRLPAADIDDLVAYLASLK
jgi:hypothetical protein